MPCLGIASDKFSDGRFWMATRIAACRPDIDGKAGVHAWMDNDLRSAIERHLLSYYERFDNLAELEPNLKILFP
jgi:hypothetical protein